MISYTLLFKDTVEVVLPPIKVNVPALNSKSIILLLFIVVFSEEEREQMRKFTNKSYLLDKRSRQHVYLGLIDILLAYCYEIRVNEGDKNVSLKKNLIF